MTVPVAGGSEAERPPLEPDAVGRAMEILRGVALRTPVLRIPEIDEEFGAEIYFKCEHLQRCGAFKFRGAYHALSRLSAAARARGVLTYSSGNHASGLALAGRMLGVSVTIAMPVTTSPVKRALARSYGAELVDCEARDREVVGERVARERGLTIIPPYDHDDIIAGQGTAALELTQEVRGLDGILAPVGGGGLLAGTALAASLAEAASTLSHAGRPDAGVRTADPGVASAADPGAVSATPGRASGRPWVIGVEPRLADDAARSLRSGERISLDQVPTTIADGLRTRYVGVRNFAVIRERVEDIVTVEEDSIRDAVARLWLLGKQLVEPSAAVPLAGLLEGRVEVRGRRVGIILSGGNCDVPEVATWVRDRAHGLDRG